MKKEFAFSDPERDGEQGAPKIYVDFACSRPNQEAEYSHALTLNQRALILVQTDDYLYKVK